MEIFEITSASFGKFPLAEKQNGYFNAKKE
jgi:hypothetical protein